MAHDPTLRERLCDEAAEQASTAITVRRSTTALDSCGASIKSSLIFGHLALPESRSFGILCRVDILVLDAHQSQTSDPSEKP